MDIENVSKRFNTVKALDSVSIHNIQGVHGFLGENGAGKTTLMRIIATVLEKDGGSITHKDILWNDKEKVRRIIGYLPQKFGVYHQLTVTEVLKHIAILKEVKGDLDKEVKRVLECVSLIDRAGTKAGELSGGMVRRVGIAQALLGNPELLIVDEPTAGLDPEERMRFRILLHEVGRDRTVLVSTHIIEDADAVCDRLTVLHQGKALFTGNCDELRSQAKGKVWEVGSIQEVGEKDWNGSVICGHIKNQDRTVVRLISEEKPDEGAVSTEPTLEEGYMYVIHQKGMVL